MHPGRLLSLWFVGFSIVLLAQSLFSVYQGLYVESVGQIIIGLSWATFGLYRLENVEVEESWPSEYGLWTFVLGGLLIGYIVWIIATLVM